MRRLATRPARLVRGNNTSVIRYAALLSLSQTCQQTITQLQTKVTQRDQTISQQQTELGSCSNACKATVGFAAPSVPAKEGFGLKLLQGTGEEVPRATKVFEPPPCSGTWHKKLLTPNC